MKKRYHVIFPLIDFMIIIASLLVAALLSSDNFLISPVTLRRLEWSALVCICFHIVIFAVFDAYKRHWYNASMFDYVATLSCSVMTMFAMFALSVILKGKIFSIRQLIIFAFCYISLVLFSRVSVKIFILYARRYNTVKNDNIKNILIVGAGQAGGLIINDIVNNTTFEYRIVGIIDDNSEKIGQTIFNYTVLGDRKDIYRICDKEYVDEIIIAIPSLERENLSELIEICNKTACSVKVLPNIDQLLDAGDISYNQTKSIEIEDLLARDPIVLNDREIASDLEGETILVTGGGGSIGSELCRQIAKYNPKRIVVLDIYENNAYDLQNELAEKYTWLNVSVVIASVRDKKRIEEIIEQYKPRVIFHAAAHKHVPLMEYNPCEAIKNNIFGTYNVAAAANKYGVEKFVMISTDKAVNPTNVMGATKRFCEMIIQSLQPVSKTEYVAVRFGNVLGSNGSVVPLFKRQIENGGPVTVTHKDITRYFMTIPEAAQLVLQASYYANGGEIFVLDMGKPIKIYDLAYNMIKLSGHKPGADIKIEVTGLRPGEKLYEELLIKNPETSKKTANSRIFIEESTFSDLDAIKESFELFEKAIQDNNNEEIRQVLQRYVSTYHPVNAINNSSDAVGA
ncbi:MAG: polysaccharide biosynthesis protein [Clostridia bacterium]|nr:polysaccharide biosynthesis protein [Clostridia bacterium]